MRSSQILQQNWKIENCWRAACAVCCRRRNRGRWSWSARVRKQIRLNEEFDAGILAG